MRAARATAVLVLAALVARAAAAAQLLQLASPSLDADPYTNCEIDAQTHDCNAPQVPADSQESGPWHAPQDAQGSVVGLADSQGSLVAEYSYGDYGETTQVSGDPSLYNPYRYTGQQFDPEAGPGGAYYLRARHYCPALGRFLSRDPIGYAGGMNPYAYCGNSAPNCADPSGEFVGIAGGDRLGRDFAARLSRILGLHIGYARGQLTISGYNGGGGPLQQWANYAISNRKSVINVRIHLYSGSKDVQMGKFHTYPCPGSEDEHRIDLADMDAWDKANPGFGGPMVGHEFFEAIGGALQPDRDYQTQHELWGIWAENLLLPNGIQRVLDPDQVLAGGGIVSYTQGGKTYGIEWHNFYNNQYHGVIQVEPRLLNTRQ